MAVLIDDAGMELGRAFTSKAWWTLAGRVLGVHCGFQGAGGSVGPEATMREVEESSKVDLANNFLFRCAARGNRLCGRRVRRLVCEPQRPQALHVLVDGRFFGSVLGKALLGLGSLFFRGLFEGIGFAGHKVNIGTQARTNQCLRQISQGRGLRPGPVSDREAEFRGREKGAVARFSAWHARCQPHRKMAKCKRPPVATASGPTALCGV